MIAPEVDWAGHRVHAKEVSVRGMPWEGRAAEAFFLAIGPDDVRVQGPTLFLTHGTRFSVEPVALSLPGGVASGEILLKLQFVLRPVGSVDEAEWVRFDFRNLQEGQ